MKTPNTNRFYFRPSAPALVGPMAGGVASGLRRRVAPTAAWLEIAAEVGAVSGRKAGGLFVHQATARRWIEFWETMVYGALAICSLATIVICLAGS
jgi:hypothetical protein